MHAASPPLDDPLAPCLDCGESVPAGLLTCPACGYDVARHNTSRASLGAVGTVLAMSGVLAPIGLPLLWAAARHRRRAAGTVTTPGAGSLRSHLVAVLRHHLAAEPRELVQPDFTRGRPSGWLDRPPEL